MNWFAALLEYKDQNEVTIGLFITAFYTANNVATILSFIYLLVQRPYSKKVLNWLLLVCFADAISCLNWAYEVFYSRNGALPQQGYIFGFLADFRYELGNPVNYSLTLFKCKFFYAVLYLPVFLSSISLSFSCCCRWFTVAFPLKSKSFLTNKRNNSLILAAVLVSVILNTGDAYSYHISSDSPKNGTNKLGAVCCKAYSDAYCIPDGSSPKWMWAILRFVKPVTMFIVYFVCLLTSVGLTINLFKARRSRSEMTGNGDQGSKNTGEMRITAILAAMSCMQFLLGMPGEILRLGVYSPKFELFEESAKKYLDAIVINNFFWDLTKANALLNWMFHTGLQKKFYLFYLPCLRRQEAHGSSQAVAQSVSMTTVR